MVVSMLRGRLQVDGLNWCRMTEKEKLEDLRKELRETVITRLKISLRVKSKTRQ